MIYVKNMQNLQFNKIFYQALQLDFQRQIAGQRERKMAMICKMRHGKDKVCVVVAFLQ